MTHTWEISEHSAFDFHAHGVLGPVLYSRLCWFICCCHCDWCRLQGCGPTLTIRSLAPLLLLERWLVPKEIKIISNLKWKVKAAFAGNLICWTLALTKLLRSLEILHHVTINHFTFFYISATLRPDSLSRQTWCELFKVSHSTCCLSCCWMVLVGPRSSQCERWLSLFNMISFVSVHFFILFFLISSPEKGNVRMLFLKVAC